MNTPARMPRTWLRLGLPLVGAAALVLVFSLMEISGGSLPMLAFGDRGKRTAIAAAESPDKIDVQFERSRLQVGRNAPLLQDRRLRGQHGEVVTQTRLVALHCERIGLLDRCKRLLFFALLELE